jgi:hypothetical protein
MVPEISVVERVVCVVWRGVEVWLYVECEDCKRSERTEIQRTIPQVSGGEKIRRKRRIKACVRTEYEKNSTSSTNSIIGPFYQILKTTKKK